MLLLDNILFWYIVIGIGCAILVSISLIFYNEKYDFLKGVVGIFVSGVFWPVFVYKVCMLTAERLKSK